MFAGNDVITISSLGALRVMSDYGFWKGDLDFIFMFNWYFLSILNGLDVIRIFFIWLGFLKWGKILGGLRVKMTLKRQMRETHLQGGHFLTPNCVFWAIVREIISIRLACAGVYKINKQEGRKEPFQKSSRTRHPEVITSLMAANTWKCVY